MKKKHFLDERKNVLRLIWVFCALCGALVILDLVYPKHVTFLWEGWFSFYAFFGFVACAALVLIAKELRKVLMRKEDYYDR